MASYLSAPAVAAEVLAAVYALRRNPAAPPPECLFDTQVLCANAAAADVLAQAGGNGRSLLTAALAATTRSALAWSELILGGAVDANAGDGSAADADSDGTSDADTDSHLGPLCRFADLHALPSAEFAALRATLVNGTAPEHRALAAGSLDVLRSGNHAPPPCPVGGVGAVLHRRDAGSVDGGRVPDGDAAVILCSRPVAQGDVLALYPAAYFRGDDASELERSTLRRLLSRILGRGLSDDEAEALHGSQLGADALDALLSYDVAGDFPPPLEGDWAGFGLPLASPASSMNDGRGGAEYAAFLQAGHAPSSSASTAGVGGSYAAEAAWLGARGAFTCRLQGITLGGVFPLCLVVAAMPLEIGETEARVDYGQAFWNCRAKRAMAAAAGGSEGGGDAAVIPWLLSYAQFHGIAAV